MCKIDLKDAYFSVPIDKSHRKYLRFVWEGNLYEFLCLCFVWEGNLYEFLCLCFGLGLAPLIFTKLVKVAIALLCRLNIRLIIFLDKY